MSKIEQSVQYQTSLPREPHRSSASHCCPSEPGKLRRFSRAILALAILALGAGVSLHLRAQHIAHWWLPFVLLALAHGVIISALIWLVARHHGHAHGDAFNPVACRNRAGHSHEGSKVLHAPRAYDWLVRALTLGREGTLRRRILDLAELKPGDSVLDIGSGTGTLLLAAADRVGPSGSLQGIEPSAEMMAHAQRKAQARHVSVIFREGSADTLPFADASFDAAFCTLVFHHLPAAMQATAIGEMCRVLKPGGRLILVDLQPPGKVSAAMSLVTFFHQFQRHGSAPDWQGIELVLNRHGIGPVIRRPVWGGSVCAVVGRVPSPVQC